VACGRNHTLALTSDGNRLYAWGDGDFGKLGLGSTTSKTTPNIVDSLRNVGLKKIACGTTFSVVLGNNGRVYTFGHGKFPFYESTYSVKYLTFRLMAIAPNH